ncbi:DUF3087 family protein [Colwellia hornerae]|uniref:DUF3087 domain-containing protein n=1 Tax=Colwellia hornerae TaxID=89402 RepID=A0A5C6Q818_9GAMM|nr:DUF3087 family protein [Colwellia hornerae]TWX57772.1 DUF3087 domain-containing protein [Colwellia hornerae]TWX62497.1 DUF3087 domain-containing protein [Colwellia hornerae]TWX65056.1 DUF3087 domain-containing protein [Colwellia hornerae]
MTLKDIDKKTYRSKLNQVIIGFIITLAILAIAFGTILIALFAEPLALDSISQASLNTAMESGQQTSNFRYNFLGVILSLLACAGILQQLKNSHFFNEIYYVWQLKQIQNIIYRRLKKIKKASVDGDEKALIILKFYYASLKQLYLLDDNTLTMSSLEANIVALEQLIAENGKEITTEQFTKVLLSNYK